MAGPYRAKGKGEARGQEASRGRGAPGLKDPIPVVMGTTEGFELRGDSWGGGRGRLAKRLFCGPGEMGRGLDQAGNHGDGGVDGCQMHLELTGLAGGWLCGVREEGGG